MRHTSVSMALALTLGAAACAGPLAGDAVDDVSNVQPAAVGAGTYTPISNFGANPGGYRMFLYTPPGVEGMSDVPLVLFFHGCTQQAAAVRNVGWETQADAKRFYLVYPEQPSANNSVNCFNWAGEYGDPANLVRGQGENQSAASMIEFMKSSRKIDPKRVYVAGFSAGGAMVAVMMATWPDLFAAGAINSGVPYRCGTTVNDAFNCQLSGRDRTPAEWGQLVRGAYSTFSGPYPRVTIWHGTSDTVVVPMNQRELRDQWTNVHGIGQTPDEEDTVNGFPRARYRKDGQVAVETVSITGMPHGVAVDPAKGCGQAGSYIINKGICSAQLQAEFMLGGGGGGAPGKPPVLTLDAPTDGTTVMGAVQVSGRVSDPDDAVTSVTFDVDGAQRGALQSPGATFQFPWDSAMERSGVRRLTLTATDQAGHRAVTSISVTVNGGRGADETAQGTCTQHYLAKRLDNARYLACGRCNGYIKSVTLYRFGARWTDDATGTGCMDR